MSIDENDIKLISLSGRRRMRLIALTATAIVTCTLYLSAKPDDAISSPAGYHQSTEKADKSQPKAYDPIPYPAGYRQWVHVKTTLIGPKSPAFEQIGGLQHIYANEKALEGYRTGRFPEGSVLVYDFLETRDDSESVGRTNEGPRRFTSVMVKNSKRYAQTGGWGYEEFRGDSQTDRMVAEKAATMCYACHTSQKERDFVFSTFRK